MYSMIVLSRDRRRRVFLLLAVTSIAFSCAQGPASSYLDRYDEGVSAWQSERYPEAKGIFQQLLSDYPHGHLNDTVKLRLAACDYSLGNFEEARGVYKEFIDSLGEHRLRALESLGNLEMLAGNYAVAAEHLRNAAQMAKKEEHRRRIEYRLALSLQKDGEFAEARKIFERLRQSDPDSKISRESTHRLSKPDFFTVQVGAYGKRQNAEAQRQQLKRGGFAARVEPLVTDSSTFYRVWIGRFTTRRHALREQRRIREANLLPKDAKVMVVP